MTKCPRFLDPATLDARSQNSRNEESQVGNFGVIPLHGELYPSKIGISSIGRTPLGPLFLPYQQCFVYSFRLELLLT